MSLQGPAAGKRAYSDRENSKKKLQACGAVGPYNEDRSSPLKGQTPPQRRPRSRSEEMYGLWRIAVGVSDLMSQTEGDDDGNGTCVGSKGR